tara:strand:- start:7 stop:210 length:204 start_codon:yes stop_codon:yes gene_type:complete
MATNERLHTLRLTWEEVIDLRDAVERRLDWLHIDNEKSLVSFPDDEGLHEEAIAVLERTYDKLSSCM